MNKKWKKPRPGRIRTTTFDYEACVPSLGYNHCTAFQVPSQILNCRMTRNVQRVAADSITERFNSNKWPSDETQEPNYNPSSIRDHLSGVEPKRNDNYDDDDHCSGFLMRKKIRFRFQVKIATYRFSIGEEESIECRDWNIKELWWCQQDLKVQNETQLLMLIKSPNS